MKIYKWQKASDIPVHIQNEIKQAMRQALIDNDWTPYSKLVSDNQCYQLPNAMQSL